MWALSLIFCRIWHGSQFFCFLIWNIYSQENDHDSNEPLHNHPPRTLGLVLNDLPQFCIYNLPFQYRLKPICECLLDCLVIFLLRVVPIVREQGLLVVEVKDQTVIKEVVLVDLLGIELNANSTCDKWESHCSGCEPAKRYDAHFLGSG